MDVKMILISQLFQCQNMFEVKKLVDVKKYVDVKHLFDVKHVSFNRCLWPVNQSASISVMLSSHLSKSFRVC